MSETIETGLKIFDIIKILFKAPKSREELTQELCSEGLCIDKSAIPKYTRTLKAAGYDIVSGKNHPFEIIKTPFRVEVSKKEMKDFAVLFNLTGSLFPTKKERGAFLLNNKILNFAKVPKKIASSKNKEWELFLGKEGDFVLKLAKYIFLNPAKLEIEYDKKNFYIVPKNIKYKTNGAFLYCLDLKTKKNKTLKIGLIKKVRFVSFYKESYFEPKDETVFEITGKLRKNYILRQYERAKYGKNKVTITNFFEDKEELFSRLLKYGKNCKVIYPKEDVEKFKDKIKKMIEYYKSV